MSHTCITLRTVCAYGHSVCAKLHVQCDKIFCKVAAMCLNLAFGPGHCRNSYLRAFLLFLFLLLLLFFCTACVSCTCSCTLYYTCTTLLPCACMLSMVMHSFVLFSLYAYFLYVCQQKNWLFCALPLENLYMKAAAFF